MNSNETEAQKADYRSLAMDNNNLTINQFLDQSKSVNTKKATVAIKKMYNSTMDSLNNSDSTNKFEYLDETSVDQLSTNLCKFFMVVSKEKGGCFNSSSINTHFLSMARYLKLRDENPVDITTDVRFAKVKEVVKARCVQSVKAGQGAGVNASKSLSADELRKVMKSDGMSRDNPRGLVTLCHYYIMTGMGARARQECRDMTNSDLIYGPSSEIEGLPEYISLHEKLTKTRRGGKGEQREVPGRVYLDSEYPDLCPVRALVFYMSKKTEKQRAPEYPFFLTVKQSAEKSPEKEVYWYTDSPMGVNLIGKLFQTAVKACDLDLGGKKITATSARKNLAQVGASASVPSALLSKLLGQKNLDSKVHYVENTQDIQRAASLVISRGVQGSDKQDFNSVYSDVKNSVVNDENDKKAKPEPPNHNLQPVDQHPVPSHNNYHPVPQYSAPQYSAPYQPPPSHQNYGYYQPPQHFGYHHEPYYHGYGYKAYPPYFPPYQPQYVPPPPQSYYQPPPPPQYNHPQYSLHQTNNYSFHSDQSVCYPDYNQANDNGKRALTDISNHTFSFKKPKI